MQNSTLNRTRGFDYENDPKYKLLSGLRKKCFTENVTHSNVIGDTFNGKLFEQSVLRYIKYIIFVLLMRSFVVVILNIM